MFAGKRRIRERVAAEAVVDGVRRRGFRSSSAKLLTRATSAVKFEVVFETCVVAVSCEFVAADLVS